MRLFVNAIVVFVGMSVGGTCASEINQRELFKSRIPGQNEAYIQLRSVMAWVRRSPHNLATARVPVTIILTLKSYKDVPRVCKLSPRLNDALVVSWSQHPLTLGYLFRPERVSEKLFRIDKTPEQNAVDSRLVTAINDVVEGQPVSEILVIMGARSLGGGVMSRLPFSSVLGCVEVVKEIDEAAAAAEKAKEH